MKYNKDTYPYPLPFNNDDGKDVFRDIPVAPTLPDVDDEFKEANCYKKDITLKGPNVLFPYTDEHKEEMRKCKNDIFYFIKNYCQILTLDTGLQYFDPYQYQKNMIKLMDENRFTIFTTARQAGKCVHPDTKITIRNKNNGNIENITIEDFYLRFHHSDTN